MNIFPPSQELPIEQRVTTLEQQMAGLLRSHAADVQVAEMDWLSTIGTWKDDAFAREADHLGEVWRQSVKD